MRIGLGEGARRVEGLLTRICGEGEGEEWEEGEEGGEDFENPFEVEVEDEEGMLGDEEAGLDGRGVDDVASLLSRPFYTELEAEMRMPDDEEVSHISNPFRAEIEDETVPPGEEELYYADNDFSDGENGGVCDDDASYFSNPVAVEEYEVERSDDEDLYHAEERMPDVDALDGERTHEDEHYYSDPFTTEGEYETEMPNEEKSCSINHRLIEVAGQAVYDYAPTFPTPFMLRPEDEMRILNEEEIYYEHNQHTDIINDVVQGDGNSYPNLRSTPSIGSLMLN